MKCGKNVLSLWINFFFNVSMVFWSCSLFWSSFSIFSTPCITVVWSRFPRYCPTFFQRDRQNFTAKIHCHLSWHHDLGTSFISTKIGSTYIKMLCYHRNNVVCSNLFIFIRCDDILQSLLGKFKGNLFFSPSFA